MSTTTIGISIAVVCAVILVVALMMKKNQKQG
jgi:tetrahydromethanopterin S-methyltransferase subunit F